MRRFLNGTGVSLFGKDPPGPAAAERLLQPTALAAELTCAGELISY